MRCTHSLVLYLYNYVHTSDVPIRDFTENYFRYVPITRAER